MQTTDDDIYLRDGESFQDGAYYPTEDKEALEEARNDASSKAASYPILNDLAEWFEQQVRECDNIDNIDMTQGAVSIESQVLAQKLLKQKMLDKAQEFAQFKEQNDA